MNFSITGEGFTTLARNLFLDDQPAKAWRVIADGLMGEGNIDKIARDVLDGKARFTGTNDLELEEHIDEEYIKQIKWLYAGRIQVRGKWYVPDKVVTNFGEDDAVFANRTASMISNAGYGVPKEWSDRRCLFYGGPNDIALDIRNKRGVTGVRQPGSGTTVNFTPCGEPPHWWPVARDAQEAVEAYEAAGRRLQETGCVDTVRAASISKQPITPPEELEAIQARRAAQNEHQEESARLHLKDCACWRAQIMEQNGPELIALGMDDGPTVAYVPRKPFMAYALGRTLMKHMAPWKPVCPPGVKLQGDNRAHTDWYVGAGYNLNTPYPYGGDLHKAAVDTMFGLQKQYANFEVGVLVPGRDVRGKIGKEVVVLPNLHPDHLEKLVGARAIITEAGGALAHLAQVALERSIPIVLVPDAVARYTEGLEVVVRPGVGRIEAEIDWRYPDE